MIANSIALFYLYTHTKVIKTTETVKHIVII